MIQQRIATYDDGEVRSIVQLMYSVLNWFVQLHFNLLAVVKE